MADRRKAAYGCILTPHAGTGQERKLMSSTQLYPFERNRYYPGKMLTSVDFQAEQDYYINKERFMNGLMYGHGIVCGLGVQGIDDQSIIVESGVAIDAGGREIVLDTSVVKKLSAIEGFDSIEGDNACLRIRYKEQDVHSVYSVSHKTDDKEYEYNRITEGYELFLANPDDEEEWEEPINEFLARERLFKSDNFEGELSIPATVCKGRNAKITLVIKKLSEEDTRLSCRGILEVPAFLSEAGEHSIEIGVEDLTLDMGEVFVKDYWVKVQDAAYDETDVILRSGSAQVFENENAVNAPANFAMKIVLSAIRPLELVSRETGRVNLEARQGTVAEPSIALAMIKLVRTTTAYIIDNVNESGIKHYLVPPSGELLRNRYLSYFIKEVDLERRGDDRRDEVRMQVPKHAGEFTNVATGTLEIPLGRNARAGDIRYSGEIAHGLGKGNVYVDIGYDYVSGDAEMGVNSKSTIYGNPDLFSRQTGRLVDVETAVKVLNGKGSFVVAAKLKDNVDYLVLSFRWVAIKFPQSDDIDTTEDYYDKSISVDTPTVVMGTKETHFFGVRFHNMKNCSISYELTSPGSGEISSDGIYTAPAKDGVYEIRIYCTDMPVICTYAYAIVKRQISDGKAETEE